MKKWILIVLIATLSLQILGTTGAQAQMQTRSAASMNWRRNTAMILFSGIGGGLLGLSTLSFYGDPKEHTGNITWGAMIGLIGGAGYIVYENTPRMQKQRISNDYYGMFAPEDMQKKGPTLSSVPTFNFEFTF